MGNGSSKADRLRSFGIRMDELMVVGGIGELVDAVLADLDPFGNTDRMADFCSDFVKAGDVHGALA